MTTGLAVWLIAGSITAAPLPDPKRPGAEAKETAFEQVMERVRVVATGQEWRKADFKDAVLETALAKLLTQINSATGRSDIALPVRFGEVQPPADVPAAAQAVPTLFVRPGTLIAVQDGARISSVRKSILLVDGSVRVTIAEESIILARGAVEVSSCRHCLILGGQQIHSNLESAGIILAVGGVARAPQAQPVQLPNVLLSGGVVTASTLRGAIVCGASVVRANRADGTTFLNSPRIQIPIEMNTKHLARVPLEVPSARKSALDGRLKITELAKGERAGSRPFVVIDQAGDERVLRPGARIIDRHGEPIGALEGWTLSFVGEQAALFRRGNDFASVLSEAAPQAAVP